MRSPKDFFRPLAVGAPDPVRRDPVPAVPDDPLLRPGQREDGRQGARPSRPPSTCCSATSRTRVAADRKEAARAGPGQDRARHGLRRHAAVDPGQQPRLAVGARRPGRPLVTEIGDKLDVIMVPKVEGAEDIHYVDRLLAQLEAQGRARRGRCWCTPSSRPPAASPTSRRSAGASPRMQGLSLGPADLAANRRMKTTRVGGGHPGYLVREDPVGDDLDARRAPPTSRTCGTTRSPAWSTPARRTGSCRTTGRSATSRTPSPARTSSATPTCSAASARGACTRCRSTSPSGSSRPTPADVAWARRVIEAMGDGTGAVMLDGKMEDDASVKQCQVIVELADAARRPRPRAAPTAYAAAVTEERP